jgi:hypothetical protein
LAKAASPEAFDESGQQLLLSRAAESSAGRGRTPLLHLDHPALPVLLRPLPQSQNIDLQQSAIVVSAASELAEAWRRRSVKHTPEPGVRAEE